MEKEIKDKEALTILWLTAEVKVLIDLLERKGITTRKEVEDITTELIKLELMKKKK